MKYTHGEIKEKSADFSPELLKRPDTDFYPAYSWIWSTPIERDEIVRQLDAMYENNIRIIYILPKPQKFRNNELSPDYLTEEYFDIYRFAMEYAAKKGMQLWLYDEGGWPSGSACTKVTELHPELVNLEIKKRTVPSPYVKGENAICAFCGGKKIAEGFVSDSIIEEYYAEPSSYYTTYPNMCMADATDCFTSLTHDAYAKHLGHMFGKQMKVAFTDEPFASRWFDGIEEKFKQKYGYDLTDFLPALLCTENLSEDAKNARMHYYDLISETFAENYVIRLRDVCRKHGLLSSGHFGGEDETANCVKHGFYSIMRQMRGLDIPGIDTIWRQIFPGKKNHFFPRFASSAANQTGSPYAVSESFAIYSMGITFEQMRYVMMYQMVRGINLINVMNTAYSYNGTRRFSGGPTFMPLLPIWKHLGVYNLYAARMSYLMSVGNPVIDYALYMPMNDFWAEGPSAAHLFEAFDNAGHELEKHHCSFDVIDDDFLETCTLEDGTLRTGTARYKAVVIPECGRMSENSKKVLEEFKKHGGIVITPDIIPTLTPDCEVSDVDIQIRKKRTQNETLYLVVNEATEEKTFSVKFPEKGNIYVADASSGDLRAANGTDNVTLASGDGIVYVISDEKYDALDTRTCGKKLCILNHFDMRPVYRFMMGTTRFETELPDAPFTFGEPCDWRGLYGKSFSGTVQYRIKFALDTIPEKGIVVDFGKVCHSLNIKINGYDVGTRCFAPYTFFAGKAILSHENVIIAEVTNTAGNEFSESSIYDTVSTAEIGPYRPIVVKYEHETAESGILTPVTVYESL
ncbi:MAG: hypothetical protein IJO52_08155 [Clostridia bacterium]|nr:hypothetical protein [Clostridia bacterium]